MTPAQEKAAKWYRDQVKLLKDEAQESKVKEQSHRRITVRVSERSHHIPRSGAVGISLGYTLTRFGSHKGKDRNVETWPFVNSTEKGHLQR